MRFIEPCALFFIFTAEQKGGENMPEHLGDIIISQEDEDIADSFFNWDKEQPSG